MTKNNLVLINAYGLSEIALRPIAGGPSALERVDAYAGSLPDVTKVRYITGPGTPDLQKRPRVELTGNTPEALLAVFPTEEFDNIFYLYADCPLLDIEVTRSLYHRHVRYLSQYSFADGYPYGIVPEIIGVEIVPKLRSLASGIKGPIERDTLFTVMQEDINAFDIETDLSPKDQRMLRVRLAADSIRNLRILDGVIAAGAVDAETTTAILDKRPELLRSVPSYVSVQIVDGCPQACSYCAYPGFGGDILNQQGEMPVERFAHIVSEVKRFCDDAVFNISTWGEPALHSEIGEIVSSALSVPGMSLIIETSGIGWPEGVVAELAGSWGDRLTWILSLDAIKPELYRQLRGNGFSVAMKTTEELLSVAPEQTYIQAVRMQESEEALEGFYRFWKEKTDHVIIQKYSTSGGVLPGRKVTDLAPLDRFPCWHIKRDLVVLLDGTVPLCREDVKRTSVLGNIFDDPIERIWQRGEAWYDMHVREAYPEMCRNCDEFYTFNY